MDGSAAPTHFRGNGGDVDFVQIHALDHRAIALRQVLESPEQSLDVLGRDGDAACCLTVACQAPQERARGLALGAARDAVARVGALLALERTHRVT